MSEEAKRETRIKSTEERIAFARKQIVDQFTDVVANNIGWTYNQVCTKVVRDLINKYEKDKDSTAKILHNHYSVSKEIAEFIFNLDGFKDFFYELTLQKVLQKPLPPMAKNETLTVEQSTENTINGFKKIIPKERDLHKTVAKIVEQGVPAGRILKDWDTNKVYQVLAEYFFNDLLALKKDKMSFILSEAKKMPKDQIQQLIADLKTLL